MSTDSKIDIQVFRRVKEEEGQSREGQSSHENERIVARPDPTRLGVKKAFEEKAQHIRPAHHILSPKSTDSTGRENAAIRDGGQGRQGRQGLLTGWFCHVTTYDSSI